MWAVGHRYVLDDNMYGKQALDTIVELVFNKPGEDIAVIMAGYEAQIMSMIRCVCACDPRVPLQSLSACRRSPHHDWHPSRWPLGCCGVTVP